jgi:predicted dehydrogenase
VGSRGSLRWEFQRFNDLDVYLSNGPPGVQGWRRVSVTTPGVHPWADRWWGSGHVIGYEETFVHLFADLLGHLGGEGAAPPSFREGLACQRVLAAVDTATQSGRWEQV